MIELYDQQDLDEVLERRRKMARRGADGALGSALAKATKWLSLSHPSTTTTGSGYSSVADMLGGSAATQSTDARRPVADTANGYPIATFTNDCLALPLDATINDNVKFGLAFWLRLGNTTGNKVLMAIRTSAGASADKLLYFAANNTLRADAMTVDRHAVAGTLDTDWHFVYLHIDSSQGTEAQQVVYGLDAAPQTVAFSSDTAWPATLGTPTGTLLIGANDAATAAFPLVGSIGTDMWWFKERLPVDEQVALMEFRPPLP